MRLFIIAAAIGILPFGLARLWPTTSSVAAEAPAQQESSERGSLDVRFSSQDSFPMFGKLVLPSARPRAIVLYVQTAEGQTM